jgi:hypothetical protein
MRYNQHMNLHQTPMSNQPSQPSYSYIPKEPSDQEVQQSVGNQYQYLSREVLSIIRPWVQYGLSEASHTSYEHALTEVAAIMYLIGQGYDPKQAHYIVESWETFEEFPNR